MEPLLEHASRPLPRRGLYALVDVDACEARGLEWLEVARAQIKGGARLLQLRAKDRSDAFVVDGLRRLRELAPRGGGTLLFGNDRADLADLAEADGVHLGQEDLPVEQARASYPHLALGLSTHNAAQLEQALSQPLDYVALGPIFATTSKRNPEPIVGVAELIRLGALVRAHGLPLVVIGGITRENYAEVAEHADLVALISGLLPEPGFSGNAIERVEQLASQWSRLTDLEAGAASADV